MKRRGFTLVELVGVLVLLGIVATIAYPIILSQFEESKDDISDLEKQIVYTGARNYVNSNLELTRDTEGYTTCVFLRDIDESGNLAADVEISNTSIVKLIREGGDYNISIVSDCTNSSGTTFKSLDCIDHEIGGVNIDNEKEYYFENDTLIYEKSYITITNIDTDTTNYNNIVTTYKNLANDLVRRGIYAKFDKGLDISYLTIKKDYTKTILDIDDLTIYDNASIYKRYNLNTGYSAVESFCN